MLRETAATPHPIAAARARRGAAAVAVALLAASLAGCGIKGALRLPPPPEKNAAADKPATAEKPAAERAATPAAGAAAPAKP